MLLQWCSRINKDANPETSYLGKSIQTVFTPTEAILWTKQNNSALESNHLYISQTFSCSSNPNNTPEPELIKVFRLTRNFQSSVLELQDVGPLEGDLRLKKSNHDKHLHYIYI